MYNQPYFIPGYYSAIPSMARGATTGAMMGARGATAGAMMGARGASHGLGLIGRLGSGFSALRSFNWSGLVNGTSKTLGVINQAIPLVRQVGPMFTNMKSMLRVASVFKDETDKTPIRKRNVQSVQNRTNSSVRSNSVTNSSPISNQEKSYSNVSESDQEDYFDHSPTFFVGA